MTKTADIRSPQHLANWMSQHIPPAPITIGRENGISFNNMVSRINNCDNYRNAITIAEEAWSILIADGYIRPVGVYGDERSACSNGRIRYVGTQRLKDAIESGNLVERLEHQDDLSAMLHPVIRNAAWSNILERKYQDAIMTATNRLEVHLRSVSGLSEKTLDGLAGRSFGDDGVFSGLIPDTQRRSLQYFFKAMTQEFRNPFHHDKIEMEDRNECTRILCFLSYLYHALDKLENIKSS
jgi:hypothetical protein